MLAELHIRNFAIIDELRITFSPGLNVLTGETGAGKSIILDAMTLMLGERADTTMVRDGSDEAYVEATFLMSAAIKSEFAQLLDAEGLDSNDDEYLLLSRELRTNGRNICRVNGRTVSLTLLRLFGEKLVDIHGQGEHLSLLRPRSHLPLLDAYADLYGDRRALKEEVKKLRAIQQELDSLRLDEKSRAQQMDMFKFQIEEINAAKLVVGEEDELRIERQRLANLEQILQHSGEALSSLTGLDDGNLAAVDLVGQAERALTLLTRVDPALTPLLEQLQGIAYQIADLTKELLAYQDELEFEPGRLDFVEERLELINRLKRKYGDGIGEILSWRDSAAARMDSFSHSEERIEELAAQVNKMLQHVGQLSLALSDRRKVAAKHLASAVEIELRDLYMDRARFEVSFKQTVDESGVYVGDQRLRFDESGIDEVEFLVSANPGESLKPLAKVASGGETSRLMLALKTVLARVDMTPTLIFDEIDQGIGGRVGNEVGQKLWRLATPSAHQVIVVTHLPQLAGYADVHYHVSKHIAGDRTTTAVTNLNFNGRIDELAAMLGTRGEHATGGAESILKQASTVKEAG